MEASHKNLSICASMCKRVPDIAVIMGIHFKSHKPCLNKLKCNHSCQTLCTGVESACIGYALYECIRDKMVGSPLEMSRSRVSHVNCNALNGKFLITFNTQGTLSMLRKNIGLVLSCMAPHKLYSKYAENCKLMKCKADRSVFNKLANEMSDAIKKNVKIDVVGKIKIDISKLKDMLVKIEKKIPTQTTEKNTSPIPKYEDYVCDYPHVNVSGIAAVAVSDYILSKGGGMSVDVFDGQVVVYNSSWKTKQTALKKADRIKDYVRQKYEKLGPDFHCVFAYLAITRNLADCCTVGQILKTKPSPVSMIEILKKSM